VIAQLDSFWQEVREPVELSQFTASGNTGGINLTWRTEAETENRGFKILRSIGTPNSMVEIASYETDPALVGAIDPTENARTYMFLDSEAVPGQTNYYQLQHVTTSDATVTHQWIEGAWTTNFSGLAINELQADNESTIADNMLEYDDWFEIVNNSTQALSLDSLYVTDDEDQLTKHRLIGNLTIPAGEHLILWADGQPEQGSNHVAFSLSSDGEQLLLVAPDGQTILDQVDFMRQFEDHSYQRHLVAPENWTYAWQPSPGFANNPPNTELFLVLNEIMTDNETTITDEAGDWDPWLEIANPLPVELDLENLSLTNNVSEPLLWELPDIEIDGNGHILIWLDGETTEGDQHAGLTVDNGSGYLGLYRTGDQMLVDSVAYPALDVDNVHARIPDNGVWTMTTLATPGAQNPTSLAPILFINEFLAKNNTTNQDSSGEYDDWVEIYNPGSEPVLLLGMFLSDDLGSSTKWAFPDVSIGPEEYLLIWCDDDPEQGPLHATFKLGASGEEIGLFSSLADGNDLIDGYSFGNQSADISEGRLQDGSLPWVFFTEPTPETTNIDVTAIEQHLPTMNGISQCHPNPFNPSVTIEYSVSAKQLASLAIYDIRGRKMRSLINGTVPAGDHLIKWDGLDNNGTSLPSGVYFVRLSFEGFAQTNKITLLR
jgi:hypothetical protein